MKQRISVEEFDSLQPGLLKLPELPKEEPRVIDPKWRGDNIRTDIQVGMIAEDCSLHIGEVIACDPYSGDVEIKSMFDGQVRRCSLYHCGVVEQTPEEIELKKKLWAEGGKKALSDHYNSIRTD